jgi:hypothetical protein
VPAQVQLPRGARQMVCTSWHVLASAHCLGRSSRRIIDSVNRPLGTMSAAALGWNAAAPIRYVKLLRLQNIC